MDEKQPDVDGIQSRAQADRNANSLDAVSTISSSDLDDTYQVYKKQDARDIDPQEARRVLWKIDLHIMPILMMTYMLQYLDKSSINFAAVFGLEKGTNLHGQDYSWLSSIFYFGKYQRTVLDVFLAHFLFRISYRSISCRLLAAALQDWQVHGSDHIGMGHLDYYDSRLLQLWWYCNQQVFAGRYGSRH